MVEVSSSDWLELLASHFAVHQSNLDFHYYQVDLKFLISAQSSKYTSLAHSMLRSYSIDLSSHLQFLKC